MNERDYLKYMFLLDNVHKRESYHLSQQFSTVL